MFGLISSINVAEDNCRPKMWKILEL
ncbi:hypothetical protein RDI58_015101 [Solanum bulbocastanum]|uniref:Uncharacterized protein n=1 Tax=Solanum bulbocastanum TaxID=147425 RepID=A0AAN8TMN2_SOLBU